MKNPLSDEDKKRNKEISSERVEIENVFGEKKVFRLSVRNIETEENDLEIGFK